MLKSTDAYRRKLDERAGLPTMYEYGIGIRLKLAIAYYTHVHLVNNCEVNKLDRAASFFSFVTMDLYLSPDLHTLQSSTLYSTISRQTI